MTAAASRTAGGMPPGDGGNDLAALWAVLPHLPELLGAWRGRTVGEVAGQFGRMPPVALIVMIGMALPAFHQLLMLGRAQQKVVAVDVGAIGPGARESGSAVRVGARQGDDVHALE